jgi:polyisoprenoid-binding protein YceI
MTGPAMTGGVASPVLPGDWVADPAGCTLAFSVRNFGLRTVTGQIAARRRQLHHPGGWQAAQVDLRAAGRLDRRSADVLGIRSFKCSRS